MAYGDPQVVEGQPRVALPYGLFSVVSFRESSDPHWQNGIEWESLTCDPVTGFSDPGCDNPIAKDLSRAGFVTGSAAPFTVYAHYNCGTFGRSLDEAQAGATARLLAREEAQAEAFTMAAVRSAAVDVNPAGALSPVTALAALEDWLGAEYGSLGVVHATRGGATVISQYLERTGARLQTKIGTPVVAGAGYSGSDPAGADPAVGETWLYATPALFGYRGQVFNSSARPGDLLDRGRNDLYAIAERNYVVGFDPCGVAAVRMTLECC